MSNDDDRPSWLTWVVLIAVGLFALWVGINLLGTE